MNTKNQLQFTCKIPISGDKTMFLAKIYPEYFQDSIYVPADNL